MQSQDPPLYSAPVITPRSATMLHHLRSLLRAQPARARDDGLRPAQAADRPSASTLYEGLFADRTELFRPAAGDTPGDWQRLLFDAAADPRAVRALADDPLRESRVRALACSWLRLRGLPVPRGLLLGMVAEVAVAPGVDVLAAYTDGRVRLLHHSGRLVLADTPVPDYAPQVGAWLDAGAAALHQASPWERRPGALPGPGRARQVWISADGLRAREGRFEDLLRDPATGPSLLAASQLLQALTRALR